MQAVKLPLSLCLGAVRFDACDEAIVKHALLPWCRKLRRNDRHPMRGDALLRGSGRAQRD